MRRIIVSVFAAWCVSVFAAWCVAVTVAAVVSVLSGCRLEPPANRPESPDSSANYSETPNGSAAAKVAAVIAEHDITPIELAAYLAELGKMVVPSRLTRVHWSSARPGTSPILYYQIHIAAARGDTMIDLYLPDRAGAIGARVRAFAADGATGQWSEWGYGLGDIFLGDVE